MGCGTNSKISPTIIKKEQDAFLNENIQNKKQLPVDNNNHGESLNIDLTNKTNNQILQNSNINDKNNNDGKNKGLQYKNSLLSEQQKNMSQQNTQLRSQNSISLILSNLHSPVKTNGLFLLQNSNRNKFIQKKNNSQQRIFPILQSGRTVDVQDLNNISKQIKKQQTSLNVVQLPSHLSQLESGFNEHQFISNREQQQQNQQFQQNQKRSFSNNQQFFSRQQEDQEIQQNQEEEGAITEQYNSLQKKPNQQEREQIIMNLSQNSLFYSLSKDQMKEITTNMFLCQTPSCQYLFKQGDMAQSYFLIKSGQVTIEIDGKEKKELGMGSGLGELALLYNARRSASIKCKEDCEFWAINRLNFRKIVEDIISRDFENNRKFIESLNFFNFLSEEQKNSIASILISLRFKQGETIVNEGDRADSFYLIQSGTVSVWKDKSMIRKLSANDSFGEQALFMKSTRAATVIADDEVKLLSLGADDLTKILGGKIQKIVYTNKQRWAYHNNELLSKLTDIQIEKLLMNTKISNYKSGTILFEKDDYCHSLIAVLDGNLKSEESDKIIAESGQIFGDFYLPISHQNEQLTSNIIIGKDAVLSIITFKQLHKLIGGDIHQVIQQNADSHEIKMKQQLQKNDYSDIKLDQLIYIKKLGQGQFGNVYLVKRKNKEELYALKCISKQQIISQNLESHLISEKNVLEMIQFPFIINFIKTFKDEQSIYFLLEYVSGLELFDVIRQIGLLSSFDAKFYTSQLILQLEYLHSRQIVYRDIKPENVMVDEKGYLKLIDLGASKILSNNKKTRGRTFTIIGTPHYMAPEIIAGKGYSYNIDLWSVGVTLYEFLCGTLPYGEKNSDPQQIYEEIISKEVQFPKLLKDQNAKLLIQQLLQKIPELRLDGSYAHLKAHPWFDNIEWDQIYNKSITAPYIPPQSKLVSNDIIKQKTKDNIKIIQKLQQIQKQTDNNNKNKNIQEFSLNIDLDQYF